MMIYDPVKGDPDSGIAPGTPFSAIPDNWTCPICGAQKKLFIPYEESPLTKIWRSLVVTIRDRSTVS